MLVWANVTTGEVAAGMIRHPDPFTGARTVAWPTGHSGDRAVVRQPPLASCHHDLRASPRRACTVGGTFRFTFQSRLSPTVRVPESFRGGCSFGGRVRGPDALPQGIDQLS